MPTRLPETPTTMADGTVAQRQRSARPWLTVTLITILALAIRLAWLGSKGLWIDEADSVYFASHALPDILSHLCDPHPPGYYVLLKAFLAFGQSEFWVRLPSAIVGAVAVPLLYALGRELGAALGVAGRDRRMALLASLLLAVAPLHVWYSQEARMYALVTALGLCAACFASRFALRRHVGDALGYALVGSAALLTDQSAALPLLLANLLWGALWLRRRRVRTRRGWGELAAWASLQAVVGIPFWLWRSQALFPALFGTSKTYQMVMVMLVLQRLGLPLTLTGARQAFFVGVAASAAMGILVCWLLAKRRRVDRLAAGLAPVVLILFVLVTVGSAIPRLFTVKRLLVSLLPCALLLSAWAMHRLRLKRWLLSALVVFSLALCGVNVLSVPKGPWREVVAVVQQEIGPNDALWVDELAVPVFDYYYAGSHERRILRATRLREVGDAWDADRRGSADGGYVWVVAMADPYRNLLDYLSPSLSQGLVWSRDWPGVSVRAYAPVSSDAAPLAPDVAPPPWLLAWPSPVDEVCQERR